MKNIDKIVEGLRRDPEAYKAFREAHEYVKLVCREEEEKMSEKVPEFVRCDLRRCLRPETPPSVDEKGNKYLCSFKGRINLNLRSPSGDAEKFLLIKGGCFAYGSPQRRLQEGEDPCEVFEQFEVVLWRTKDFMTPGKGPILEKYYQSMEEILSLLESEDPWWWKSVVSYDWEKYWKTGNVIV